MPNNLIRRLLILGALAIAGILFIQSYWVIKTLNVKEQEFNQTVFIALRKVAESIARFNNTELPKQDLIQRRSSNYYSVNINDVIDANVLEDYLIREFEAHSLNTDFEYAVYDCVDQELVYGNYCKLSDDTKEFTHSESLPKFDDLIYYFVVKFPSKSSFLLSGMWTSILFSFIALLAVIFFMYSIWVILAQKRLSEMQKDFINNMTHEFKTPISSIRIASDVLLTDPAVKENERTNKYASIIKDQNLRLNKQVERVLALAKLEKEGFKLKKEKIEIHSFLEDIIMNENARLAQHRQGSILADFCSETIFIMADKVHFSSMIYNILDNAEKYCNKTPQITVKTSIDDHKILLKIIDNGIGIQKENIPKLFKKFYRVPTGNVHDVKGFGLGLYYVKNIVDSHRWKIDVDSRFSEGTTVTFFIPIISDQA